MNGINKRFGANKVLRGVDVHFAEGEVHALVGENGAGKSTLMNILTGVHEKNAGSILIDGKETVFSNPKEAEEQGIYFIHQELNTWPEMTVLDNLFMNKAITGHFGWVKVAEMKEQAKAVFSRLKIDVPLDMPIGQLSMGQQQLIEIAKSLMGEAKVIIMDEPTASLTEHETRRLFEIIADLTAQNVTIIYISHRMNEIFSITDRLTIMRDGVSVLTTKTADITEEEVVQRMVGRDIDDYYTDNKHEIKELIFEADNISCTDQFENVSFDLHAGEILGVSGLIGAGRTEIMRAIFGVTPLDSGEMRLNGKKYLPKTPQDAIKHGFGFLTENRKDEGLILDFSISDNVTLPIVSDFTRAGLVSNQQEKEFVDLLIKRLAVKTTSAKQPVKDLSGGNQQKVVLAKWIGARSQILILDEPTRGVDVGAKREIYGLMDELASHGVAMIVVSSDLPEIIGISDRVLIVHEGKIAGEATGENINEEYIMTLATGGK